MNDGIHLHLRDLSKALASAWKREFLGAAEVEISCGDIFSTRAGQLTASDPIDVKADAIVSPANSFGFMNGGIDAVYTYQFGPQVQDALRAELASKHAGELPVGSAVIVPTGNADIPWCISAPTMRIPANVADTANAFLALRAALMAVLEHNQTGQTPIRTVLCPGLGTAVGSMPIQRCARQMRVAWERVLGGKPFTPNSLREATNDELMLRA